MCEYCNSSGKHHSSCPLADSPKVVYQCYECGFEIYEGDDCRNEIKQKEELIQQYLTNDCEQMGLEEFLNVG